MFLLGKFLNLVLIITYHYYSLNFTLTPKVKTTN